MATNGLLIAVRWEWDGTELTADAAAGVTVLNVLDSYALSIDETCWVGGTGPYTVTDQDEVADTITITPALSAAMETATEVAPDVGGQPAQVWVAEVDLPDALEPIEVPLTVHDLAVMPEGEYDPPVAIIISDDLQSVIDLPGNLPVVSGDYIPPETLPPPTASDGFPPALSPQPEVIGGLGAFFLRWVPPSNADSMRFEVHVSPNDGFVPTSDTFYTEVSAYSVTVRSLASIDTNTGLHVPFQYDTNYYFRLVAKDVDGSAPPGTQGVGQMVQVNSPDIATHSIIADNIAVASLTGDLFAGSVVLGSTISTGACDDNGNIVGSRIYLGPEGLINYDATGTPVVKLPIDPKEDAFVKAHMEMLSADVDDNFTMHGTNNSIAASSKLMLGAGITPPTSPPTLTQPYDTVQLDTTTRITGGGSWPMGTFNLDPSQIRCFVWVTTGVLGPHWMAIQQRSDGFRVWRFNADGTIKLNPFSTPANMPWIDDFKGFFKASGSKNGTLMMAGSASASAGFFLFGGAQVPASWIINSSQDPLIAWDEAAQQHMLCQNATGSTPKTMQVRRFTASGGTLTSQSVYTSPSTVGANTRINGLYYGSADFGGPRYVDMRENSVTFIVFSGATRYNANGNYAEWKSPIAPVGFDWDGTYFWSCDSNGLLTKYTGWTWTAEPMTTWVGASARDTDPAGVSTGTAAPWPGQAAGTHETAVGSLTSITQQRRAKLVITVNPTADAGGVD